MKKLLFISIILLGVVFTMKAQPALTPKTQPTSEVKFKWITPTVQELGKIEQNKPAPIVYEFVNDGKAPLVITHVQVSCGCTAADYSKEPIAPGKKGFVKATFNAASVGPFTKSLTVTSNSADPTVVLTFKGEVVSKK